MYWVNPVYGSKYKNSVYFHSCIASNFYIWLLDYKSKRMLAQWESQKKLKIKQDENTTRHPVSKAKKKIIKNNQG